jgi:hypothetical protein
MGRVDQLALEVALEQVVLDLLDIPTSAYNPIT